MSDNFLECADPSALSPVATCRGHGLPELIKRCGVESPETKAVTGRRRPKRRQVAALQRTVRCGRS